jgi:hypothetical protein
MAALPISDWQATLANMDAALAEMLATLDLYQSGWDAVLAEQASSRAGGAAEARLPDRLEDRLRDWNARLSAATELAASVERELNDRETVIGRWQELFAGWREVIQRGMA